MTTDTKAPKFKCEVYQDKEEVPDPLNEGEKIRCLECDWLDGELSEKDGVKCPYCEQEQEWCEWPMPREGILWEGQERHRVDECSSCGREFTWSYTLSVNVTSWPLDKPDGTRTDESDRIRDNAEKTRKREAEPTREEWLHNARATLRNASAIIFPWGVVIPLPMDAQSLMQATDAARALGFGLVSQRLAERVEPMLGPVVTLTQEGSWEGAWLDFLTKRAKP